MLYIIAALQIQFCIAVVSADELNILDSQCQCSVENGLSAIAAMAPMRIVGNSNPSSGRRMTCKIDTYHHLALHSALLG